MSRDSYKFGEPHQPHFLTCTIVAWQAVFTRRETVQFILDSWKYLQDKGRMTLYGYVILENHLHLVASAEDLSKEIGDFKSFTARQIIDYLRKCNAQTLLQELRYYKLRHKTDSDYQLWQEGSHPKAIDGDDMMVQKLEYMHDNPVRRGAIRALATMPACRGSLQCRRSGGRLWDIPHTQGASARQSLAAVPSQAEPGTEGMCS